MNSLNVVDQVMERTETLMMKAIVRYREDQDLENAIDFIQKKVKNDLCPSKDSRGSFRPFITLYWLVRVCCVCSFSAAGLRAIRTGPVMSTLSVWTQTPVWKPAEFPSPAALTC